MAHLEGFLREPHKPFGDLRKEDYCQARARGLNSAKASEEAGVNKDTGLTWAKRDEILARIREIRDATQGYTEVSAAYVLSELKTTINQARDAGQFKAAIDGLKILHDVITKNKDGMRAAALGLSRHLVTKNEATTRKALRDDLSQPDVHTLLGVPRETIDTTAEVDDDDA